MKKCSFCAEEIQEEAVKCRYCGSEIGSVPPSLAALPSYTKPKLLPKDFLMPKEEIFLEIRPHWSNYFGATLIFGIITLCVIFSSLNNGIIWFFITLGIFFINKAGWEKAVYAITNRRVIHLKGFVSKDYKQCPLDKIQNIALKTVGFNNKLGNISFDTAGSPFKELVWCNVLKPTEVYQKISTILHK